MTQEDGLHMGEGWGLGMLQAVRENCQGMSTSSSHYARHYSKHFHDFSFKLPNFAVLQLHFIVENTEHQEKLASITQVAE